MGTPILVTGAAGRVGATGRTVTELLLKQGKAVRAMVRSEDKGAQGPRVITVDGNPSYPTVIDELKQQRALGRRCYCRVVPYLNNIVEQDHRAIKRRVNACLGFRSFDGAQRTIQGYEAMHMIRKGQVRWLAKGDVTEQVRFINVTFGLAA